MSASSLLQLVVLSAIWGASFLFMRIAVPYLGPVMLIEFRVALAALFLLLISLLIKNRLRVRTHWKHYLVLGLFNSALPFVLLAYAAQELGASLLSVLNATAPIWGVLIASAWSRTLMTAKKAAGLLLGIIGVYLLVGLDNGLLGQNNATLAIAASLAAAFSYGVASNIAQRARRLDPLTNAHGSLWAASLLFVPLLPFFPVVESPPGGIVFAVVALGVLCTAIAYLLYFRLIADIGAGPALTVTYLIPLFGILWGVLFLQESIGWHTLLGTAVVLSGTAFVTDFSIDRLLGRKVTEHA